jgi:hypothetical protein
MKPAPIPPDRTKDGVAFEQGMNMIGESLNSRIADEAAAAVLRRRIKSTPSLARATGQQDRSPI